MRGTNARCAPRRPGPGGAPRRRSAGRACGRRSPSAARPPARTPACRTRRDCSSSAVSVVVGEAAERGPGIDAQGVQRLAAHDVADARRDGLVEQHLADRPRARASACARAATATAICGSSSSRSGPRLRSAGWRAMRARSSNSSTGPPNCTAHDAVRRSASSQALPARARHGRALGIDVPGAGHAQVRVEDAAVVEGQRADACRGPRRTRAPGRRAPPRARTATGSQARARPRDGRRAAPCAAPRRSSVCPRAGSAPRAQRQALRPGGEARSREGRAAGARRRRARRRCARAGASPRGPRATPSRALRRRLPVRRSRAAAARAACAHRARGTRAARRCAARRVAPGCARGAAGGVRRPAQGDAVRIRRIARGQRDRVRRPARARAPRAAARSHPAARAARRRGRRPGSRGARRRASRARRVRGAARPAHPARPRRRRRRARARRGARAAARRALACDRPRRSRRASSGAVGAQRPSAAPRGGRPPARQPARASARRERARRGRRAVAAAAAPRRRSWPRPRRRAATAPRSISGSGRPVLASELVEVARAQQRGAHSLGGGIGRRRRLAGRRPEQGGVLAERDRDAPGVGAEPHDLAARAELVEQLGAVLHAQGQHLALPDLGRERQALEREEHLAQALDAAPAAVRPMPCQAEREARQRGLLDGLDLASQAGDRGAADAAQHLDVAPFAAAAARAQRAVDERALALERARARARRRPARGA